MGLFDNLAKQLIRTQGTRKGVEQILGSRWGWLADIREGIERNDPLTTFKPLYSSDLSPTELRTLAKAANKAADMKEAQ